MIPLGIIAAAIAGGGAIAKGVVGAKQLQEGKELLETERPEYAMPQQEQFILESMLGELNRGDVLMNRTTELSELSGANAMANILESGAGFSAITQVQANKDASDLNAVISAESMRMEALGKMLTQRQRMSDYQDKEFMFNEFSPYADAQQEGRDLRGAGMENIFSGIDTVGNMMGYLHGIGGGSGVNTGFGTGTTSNNTTRTTNQISDPMEGFGYIFD